MFLNVGFRPSPLKPVGNESGHRPRVIGGDVEEAMAQQGDPIHPKTAREAHAHMVDLLDVALADDRSAFIVTVKYLSNSTIDVKLGIMNLDQHEKGLLMVAFAIVHMHRKSGSDIGEDVANVGRLVERMLE